MRKNPNEKTKKTGASRKKGHTSNKKQKTTKVSYNRRPDNVELRDWQIALRQQYGKDQVYTFENIGNHPVYSDFKVFNPESKSAYRVAIRSQKPGKNFCACMDFKTNGLGTCKHIEFVLYQLGNKRGYRKYFKETPNQTYSSVYLSYAPERRVLIRIGTEGHAEMTQASTGYFDKNAVLQDDQYAFFDQFLARARIINPEFRCYEDAMEFVLQQRENQRRSAHIAKVIKEKGNHLFDRLLKAKLFEYQFEGATFAAKAGRCLLADEMGLGKTIQAIAACELWRKELGITRVLITCPTSLKYQWKTEIEKFTDSTVEVVEGNPIKREKIYKESQSFYLIATYNAVMNDVRILQEIEMDVLILDEAQRIKNWNTKISAAVKKIRTEYVLVLTGTPLENKLEELYSVMQVVDQFKLGPLYQFLHRHQVKDDFGKLTGYRDLGEVKKSLSDVLVRRLKKEVLKQLPKRLDQNILVPMTTRQHELHQEYTYQVAQIVAKWRRFGFLREKDRQKMLICLNLMRMACDSTYLIDQESRFDTKIDELMCILEDAFTDVDSKAVVFSQWERMTRLVALELEERGIGFVSLHGRVPAEDRGKMLVDFANDQACKVFLSTDAGGVGLNLQSASLLINLDIPWNPGVLEQRIGRIYRLGQERNVHVINLISAETIEHRMLGTLAFKSAMAAGVLDGGDENIFLDAERFKKFMENVEQLTDITSDEAFAPESVATDTEEDLEAIPDAALPTPDEMEIRAVAEEDVTPDEAPSSTSSKPVEPSKGLQAGKEPGIPGDAAQLVQMGAAFFSGLAQTLRDESSTQKLVQTLVQKDKDTGQTYLKIPVENSETVEQALNLLGGLLKGLFK